MVGLANWQSQQGMSAGDTPWLMQGATDAINKGTQGLTKGIGDYVGALQNQNSNATMASLLNGAHSFGDIQDRIANSPYAFSNLTPEGRASVSGLMSGYDQHDRTQSDIGLNNSNIGLNSAEVKLRNQEYDHNPAKWAQELAESRARIGLEGAQARESNLLAQQRLYDYSEQQKRDQAATNSAAANFNAMKGVQDNSGNSGYSNIFDTLGRNQQPSFLSSAPSAIPAANSAFAGMPINGGDSANPISSIISSQKPLQTINPATATLTPEQLQTGQQIYAAGNITHPQSPDAQRAQSLINYYSAHPDQIRYMPQEDRDLIAANRDPQKVAGWNNPNYDKSGLKPNPGDTSEDQDGLNKITRNMDLLDRTGASYTNSLNKMKDALAGSYNSEDDFMKQSHVSSDALNEAKLAYGSNPAGARVASILIQQAKDAGVSDPVMYRQYVESELPKYGFQIPVAGKPMLHDPTKGEYNAFLKQKDEVSHQLDDFLNIRNKLAALVAHYNRFGNLDGIPMSSAERALWNAHIMHGTNAQNIANAVKITQEALDKSQKNSTVIAPDMGHILLNETDITNPRSRGFPATALVEALAHNPGYAGPFSR